MLTEALGKSANIQTIASQSIPPQQIPVQIFLREQRHVPLLTLVRFEDAEQVARSTRPPFVYVVNRIAPLTASAWRNKGQSFIDLQGTVFVEVPGLLVDKKVRLKRQARQTRSHPVDPFSDRASNISRYLLNHPPAESWGVRELAAVSHVSLGTASKVIRALEERDLVVVTRKGRSAAVAVPRPKELFKSWANSYDWKRNPSLTVRAPVADPREFLKSLPRKLPAASHRWAATLQAGASMIAPHATWKQVHLYVDVQTATLLEKFSADLNWPPAPDGRVTLMRPYYRESVWQGVHKHGGVPVVDPLQLAIDLWNYPVRGREQAEYILRRKLPWILDIDD